MICRMGPSRSFTVFTGGPISGMCAVYATESTPYRGICSNKRLVLSFPEIKTKGSGTQNTAPGQFGNLQLEMLQGGLIGKGMNTFP